MPANYPGSTRKRAAILAAALVASTATAALATETITYQYDARGRLKKVERAGTVNNGVITSYAYDKAHNRIDKATTGAPPPSP